ncbi:MAG: Glu/Leu/Phe/Val dehydrogenase [Deltaproteobacteria bacterium]|nr:Glu/Leu/Phe/Val dehydrogenase [Deltaproteobacteria bacterium]
MDDTFKYADQLGPLKIMHVHEPKIGLKGILVVDNVAAGPSIGGLRMATDVSLDECFRLARAMTMKNAAAGLAHGGGKSVLFGDPYMPLDQKEELIRCFAAALKGEEHYIFGPDMGTDEVCMAWIKDEIGRSVGLPAEVGGIPLDVIGATGFGISVVADIAIKYCDFDMKGARIVVQGFGSVGKHGARFLTEKGAVLVGAADSRGSVYNPDGLDVEALMNLKKEGKTVADYKEGKKGDREDVIAMECDIWIPAARPDVIHDDNADRLKTKLIISGANIPVTHSAEKALHERGILCVPDFIANAGGVICAAVEYHEGNETIAFQTIEEKIHTNTKEVLERMDKERILPRQAAVELATERVKNAMTYKRWNVF